MSASKYERRGVSASKREVHRAIANLDKGLHPNAFCKILPDVVGRDREYANIMHADTAGTKTSLAYLYWKETGDLSVWKGIAQDAIVMNVDDMACVGCIDHIVLSSTIGRNKHLITGDVIQTLISAAQDFVERMRLHEVHIHLAGGETADVGDIVRTLDVGYTTFARMPREQLIINNLQEGDCVVGWASFGQAIYEDAYNSGIGSNGLTSARHDVLSDYYRIHYPESFDGHTPEDVVYTGSKRLTDLIDIDGTSMTIGQLLLSPTRTYLPALRKVLSEIPLQDIHGLIHCTGGAQTKVKKFAGNHRVVKNQLFDIPAVFTLIQSESATDWREMYEVFNMGHRLEFYVPEKRASQLIDLAAEFNIEARIIGHVEDASSAEVFVLSPHGNFTY